MADSTAMTVDFLRARLLSERSVSRAAKERADELAKRVAELEEQVRAVTAQRRQAERAAAEVLAILESQGFGGHLSDGVADDDSDSDQDGERQDGDDADGRGDTARATGEEEEEEEPAVAKGEAEDALSGTAQPGGLSWRGRSVSPRKARQLKHKHGRRYFYLLSSGDSSPKYRMGQSCCKNKRRVELMSNGSRSSAPEDGGGGAGSHKRRQDGSDVTDDGQADMDGEVGGDEQSSGDGGGGQYVIRYEKDGEMERVLEKQAELIGQYEEEEKAQREWEKQYNENKNANKVVMEVKNKAYETDAESNKNDLPITISPSSESECLPNGSLSQENGAQRREASNEPDNGLVQTPSISAQESSTTSTVTRQDQDRGDLISDGDSGYNANAKPFATKVPSDGSPSSDTLNNSKVSDWSSSQFYDNTDSQAADAQPYRPASTNIEDIESVLQALQSARISLSAKLSKPVPPNQVTLALPAPGDEHREYDDLMADDGSCNSFREELGSSSPARQEILALPAPEDLPVHDTGISVSERQSSSSPRREEILALPAPGDDYHRAIEDYRNIPVGAPGLFRLPTDSFPVDEKMFSASISLRAPPAVHGAARSAPSVAGDGSGIPAKRRYDLQSPALLPVPTPGRCNVPTPDFTVGTGSAPFLPGILGLELDLRRTGPLGNADLFMQRGIDYTISNKWML